MLFRSVAEGVVAGGGLALAQVGNAFTELTDKKDDPAGSKLVDIAVLEPIKQIAANAGKDGSLVLYNIMKEYKAGNKNLGYNAMTDEFEDMFAAGIVDPTKVVRSALENAASTAIMFLTTEAVIADKPEKKEHNHGGGSSGGYGGMDPSMMGM